MTPDLDRCAAVRDRLLDAGPHTLRGEGDDAVARHLRDCDGCRATAELLLAGTAALDAALSRLSSGASAAAVRIPEAHETDRMSAGWSSPPSVSGEGRAKGARRRVSIAPSPPSAHRRRRRAARWAALPLTAVVAALIVLVGRPADDPAGEVEAAALRDRAERLLSPSAPGVEASGGVAVIRTADPDVTLVWLLR